MNTPIKKQSDILKKLDINKLNDMQKNAITTIEQSTNTVLLSPTGTGKTLAFLLPTLRLIKPDVKGIQALIVVPSRELAIQIEQVIRKMGTGLKINAIYGGRAVSKDRLDLQHAPSILIGTPGRISDHIERQQFDTETITTLILDEFDKSLEIGFEKEMKKIIAGLHNLKKRILTSATESPIPGFVGFHNQKIVNWLTDEQSEQLILQMVISPTPDKQQSLIEVLQHIGNEQVIIFCSLKSTIGVVKNLLAKHKLSCSCFSGGMEQRDRERSLIKFRNGTSTILIATDLAARGIDIPEMKHIIHFELPDRAEEFIHRNGRTARADSTGTAYVIHYEQQPLPDFLQNIPVLEVSALDISTQNRPLQRSEWETLFISGGRKDKISKGDIAGLFFKQGKLSKEQLGIIELKQDCAFVAVPVTEVKRLIKTLNNTRLKNKKVRIMIA